MENIFFYEIDHFSLNVFCKIWPGTLNVIGFGLLWSIIDSLLEKKEIFHSRVHK